MIGNYVSTGIVVRHSGRGGWGAVAKFIDAGFCDDDADAGRVSTEGEVRSRYFLEDGEECDGLTPAINAVKADVEHLGITWTDTPHVYYEDDGEWKDWPAPDGWRETVNAQAVRLGWEPIYRTVESVETFTPKQEG